MPLSFVDPRAYAYGRIYGPYRPSWRLRVTRWLLFWWLPLAAMAVLLLGCKLPAKSECKAMVPALVIESVPGPGWVVYFGQHCTKWGTKELPAEAADGGQLP